MTVNEQLNQQDIEQNLDVWTTLKKSSQENDFLKSRVRELYQKIEELDQDLKELKKEQGLDQSTGLYNQTYFLRALKYEVDRAKRYCHFFSVIVMHLALARSDATVDYDREIRKQKKALDNLLRKSDVIARYQKKQIILLLPETDEDGGKIMQERVMNSFNPDVCHLKTEILTYPKSASKLESFWDIIKETSDQLHNLK